MVVIQFWLAEEISWNALKPILLFGLIGPLWALAGVVLILTDVIKI